MTTISNIISKSGLRTKQLNALEVISNALMQSFGPNGSNTQLFLGVQYPTVFTKDGHRILGSIKFAEPVEESVRRNMEEATRYITKTVGDGTTSVAILSYLIFNELNKMDTNGIKPYELMRVFKQVVSDIQEKIKSEAKEIDLDTIYNICMISTNGNEEVSKNIKDIYEKYGFDVYINLQTSSDENTYLKSYDGMSLDSGYGDPSFINDPKNNTCVIRNPRIYSFIDPVDTREMINLFNTIISNNIIIPMQQKKEPIPTVILTTKISRDMNSYLNNIIDTFYQYNKSNRYDMKPPFLFITNIDNKEKYSDITKLCGCPIIKKYIDFDVQEHDIKEGLAPTVDNICEFYGTCDMIESDCNTTKIINPYKMFERDENGNCTENYSHIYKELLDFLETELKNARKNNEDIREIYRLKQRIGSLKANMVDYMVGGVSSTERDDIKDLLDDAIKNCKSTCKHGYGYAANVQAYIAIRDLQLTKYKDSEKDSNYIKVLNLIEDSYLKLITSLYSTCLDDEQVQQVISEIETNKKPYNLRTNKFDDKVVTSIETDVIILDVISKIVTLMFISNQFLLDKPVVSME